MGSFSGLVIGLSFVFGCILMGLFLELYYLLWWKKRMAAPHNNTRNTREIEGFSLFFCWKKPSSLSTNSSVRNPQLEVQEDLEMGSSKELGLKSYGEEGIETELMRVHNLCGPPRFLFTIKEENNEDFESDDVKSRSSRRGSRTKSLGDVFGADATPLSSPNFADSCNYRNSHGFNNPLFESLSEAEVNRLRSSPPPKFKFLKDAEDKLIRRLLIEEAERKRGLKNGGLVQDSAFSESQSSRMEDNR